MIIPKKYCKFIWSLDCTKQPFQLPDGVDAFYDDSLTDLPVAAGSKVYYKCTNGKFSDGKSWVIGKCKKDGSGVIDVEPLSDCTTEHVKVDGGAPEKKEKKKVSRKAQSGGRCFNLIRWI